ncbi:MAG: hypothetical protein HOY79_17780 [Streptomyces sp.]|nr:hypothetical protein [Streptomyces sp.]
MADHYSRILDFALNMPAEGDAIAGFNRGGKRYELTGADLLALLAETKRLRLQNEELSSENHVLQYGPTMSAEEWEA